MTIGWREAMQAALYGPGGFFTRDDTGPADHFRTSVHASPLFATALLRLIHRIDAALGHPDRFDLVDVGAGRGELLTGLGALLQHDPGALRSRLAERIRPVAVEKRPQPAGLPPGIRWQHDLPDDVTGLLIGTEWLDDVPLDIAERDEHGVWRRVLVDPGTGVQTLAGPVDAADRFWLSRWWPSAARPSGHPFPAEPVAGGPAHPEDPGVPVGERAEIGWPRDVAWADAVSAVRRGGALAVDYGHLRADRPRFGTMTGFRDGRQVAPVPDGRCDVTAHVAMDAVACAAGVAYALTRQREALRALGVDGGRPPLDLARTDPAAYLRALSTTGAAAELTDPDGLGGHWWLLHTVGVGDPEAMLAAGTVGRSSRE